MAVTIEEIHELVPEYETDMRAIGENRQAVDPDGDRPWHEMHGLTEAEIEELQ